MTEKVQYERTDNLSLWAAIAHSDKNARDFTFVYVWTLAKLLAYGACRDSADKIQVGTAITATLMNSIDKGNYAKANANFTWWCLFQAASAIRSECASIYRARVATTPFHEEWDKSTVLASEETPLDEQRLADELVMELFNGEDEEQVRILQLVVMQGMGIAEAGERLGYKPTKSSRLYHAAFADLRERLDDESE